VGGLKVGGDAGHPPLNQAGQAKADPAPGDLLTVTEAAQIARRSVRTLRRAYRRGALPAYRDGNGRTVRIQYADLSDWMRAKPVVSHRDGLPRSRLHPPS
jgi:excisionase family DNA binding protein